jgi:hypothetical protein
MTAGSCSGLLRMVVLGKNRPELLDEPASFGGTGMERRGVEE